MVSLGGLSHVTSSSKWAAGSLLITSMIPAKTFSHTYLKQWHSISLDYKVRSGLLQSKASNRPMGDTWYEQKISFCWFKSEQVALKEQTSSSSSNSSWDPGSNAHSQPLPKTYLLPWGLRSWGSVTFILTSSLCDADAHQDLLPQPSAHRDAIPGGRLQRKQDLVQFLTNVAIFIREQVRNSQETYS